MSLTVIRLRRWFAAAAIVMIAAVAGMYFYARGRVRNAVHEVPKTLGLNIEQTAEGFSISKSFEGRTLCTVSASKVVQFKQGGQAELHDVKITIYGKDSRRYDRVTGDDFEYNPTTGDVRARGKVLIDLEGNPAGPQPPDQAAPAASKNPIRLETNGLVFNSNSGNASASGKVTFQTSEGSGSAVGVEYLAKARILTLRSLVQLDVSRPHQAHVTADRAVITRAPRQVVLSNPHLSREQQKTQAERATLLLRDDNTVERVVAGGNVESEIHGRSDARSRSDQAVLFLEGR